MYDKTVQGQAYKRNKNIMKRDTKNNISETQKSGTLSQKYNLIMVFKPD
jgi:hypothetical protein